MIFLLIAVVAYFLGSIPFGYLLVRVVRGEDVRQSGSGNIGATNVARSSPALGLLTLLLDAGKGAVAVVFAYRLTSCVGQISHNVTLSHDQWIEITNRWVWPFARHLGTIGSYEFVGALAALFAILGHLFPVWLKFRGGKGVATALGSFLVVAPKSIVGVVGIFALVLLIFRYVSVSSVMAVACFPVAAWIFHEYGGSSLVLILMSAAAVLVIWKHRSNLERIVRGTEPKFGRRS